MNLIPQNILTISIFNLCLSSLIVILFIPRIILIGKKFNLVDKPNKRRVNLFPKISIGGLALFFGFFFSVISSLFLFDFQDFEINLIINILFVSCYFFLIGFLDDIFNLKTLLRLILQFLGAFFIYLNLITINSIGITLIDQLIEKIPFLSLIFTLVWIVGITNALNWMDGLDGLASGISIITSLGVLGFGIINGSETMVVFSTSIIGACLGFMKYNYYPSKVMMGDGGSYFLGIILSYISLACIESPNSSIMNASDIYISTLLLGLPIFDMFYVISIRLFKGLSPFSPDNNHIHHRLINKKVSHLESVNTIYIQSNFFVSIVALFNFGFIGLLWFILSLILLLINLKKISLKSFLLR